ncbi:MAG: hypothetical protein ACRC7W_06955 [Fusobacteriaceae bacterium]
MASAIMNVTDVVRSVLKFDLTKEQADKPFYVVGSGPIYDALKHVQERSNSDVYVEFSESGWLYALCDLDFAAEKLDNDLLESALNESYKNGYGIYFIAK